MSMTSALALTVLALSLVVPGTTSWAPSWGSHHRVVQAIPTGQASSTALFADLSAYADLSADQKRARDVFSLVAESKSDSGTIDEVKLGEMLRMLDINASDADAEALFRYLDLNDDGSITFDEFLPWWDEAAATAQESASTFQSIIMDRRTVHLFDKTPVSDDVLRRAVKCAISAPNRSGSEPWRFIQVGPSTVEKIAQLNKEIRGDEGSFSRWVDIPGWCVVTHQKLPDDAEAELENFKSTCCAVENFMLSMWSEGIGTKWTVGPVQLTPEFAELCGINSKTEKVAGVIWYGFASGGLTNVDRKQRQKGVDEVLFSVP
jgi:nitroreductase